jgi:hypothetical protein
MFTGLALLPSVHAGPFDFNVTVTIAGVPSFYYTRVFADGVFKGTVSGGVSLSIAFSDSAAGVSHTVTVDRYVPDGYPYYAGFPYYSGYWGITYQAPQSRWSFVGPLTNGTSNTFYYYPLFLLQINSEHGSPHGGGWYPGGAWAPISVEGITGESGGTRFRFDRWEGGNFGVPPTEPNNRVYMDAPKTVTAKWITQYLVTVNSDHGTPTGGGWYDANTAVSLSVASLVPGTEGIRYLFTGWSGDYTGTEPTASVIVTRPMIIVAKWKTQYWVTVDANGGEVNQQNQWLDEGSKLSISATSPSAVVQKSSRLVFTGWTGSVTDGAQSITVAVSAPMTVKANWKTQYYLSISTPYSEAVGEGWYDAGSTATFSLRQSKVPDRSLGWVGVDNVFTYWSGDSKSTLPSGSLVMDSPKSLAAVWTTNYATLYIASILGVFFGLAAIWKRSAIGEYVGPAFGRSRTKPVPTKQKGEALTKKSVPNPGGNIIEAGKMKPASCPSCGTRALENADFCVECGTQL